MEQFKVLIAYLRTATSSDEGATAVEYSLLAALIAGGLIVAVTALRDDIKTMIDNLITAI
ncbi:Flp pilus assembly pilin Flp [Actinoplanes lutulentus]|uniref:Flp/Fap pilin component n=1 Tax=Actinoplanes lutulentus TaxID=1287878 RepID=A0A327ZLC5_9ACTN|nr:Flp family type IVb pilin [Actinoplanes lutulentus]MBB2940805.1 Flp pilus assembly pilin Flp [Actinoplanes lutulentus]RAK43115.1 Flp/Fap pilin component [Actinoplanes lutulentus]